MQYLHEPTNLLITGAIDDIWVDPKGRLLVVDYKSTSTTKEIDINDGTPWKDAYKRQMEIYQWLLEMNGFKVSDTGYWVYVNADAVTVAEQQRLRLLDLTEAETKDALVRWIARSVREQAVTMEDMQSFVEKTIDVILGTQLLAHLYASKFALRDSVSKLVQRLLIEEAERRFRALLAEGNIVPSREEQWHIPQSLTLLHPMKESFSKHLFDRCDDLNGEELVLARQLDAHANVAKNSMGLHLQGYRPHRFYPDFIVRTNNGAWWVLEYKGADRIGSLDTTYKEELGKIWSEVCGDSFHFRLVGEDDIADLMETLST